MRILVASGKEELENPFLGMSNYEIRIARHKEGVLQVASEFKPDIVVLNPFLPGVIRILDMIREIRLKVGAQVILLVGHLPETADGRNILRQAAKLGVYDFVYNQVTVEAILEHIERPAKASDVAEYLTDEETVDDPPLTAGREENGEEGGQDVIKRTVARSISTLNTTLTTLLKPSEEHQEREEDGIKEEKTVPLILDHVIAVGGPSGCGSSFVAWNMATVAGAVLMEGRRTGTLAKWLRVKEERTRDAFLAGKLSTKYAVTADRPMTDRDLQLLANIHQPIVVDVGNDLDSVVWERARKKILVVTPDPQYEELEFPDSVVRVLNRFPEAFPSHPDKVFKVRIDLVIPDMTRDVFLSLWAGVPWIMRQPDSVKDQWRSLVGFLHQSQEPERVGSSWSSW